MKTTNESIAVRVRLFAALREELGVSEMNVELPTGTTAEDLLEHLCRVCPTLGPHVAYLGVAVNCVYVDRRTQLHDGDEIAYLPPVGGG